ncbi:Gfo/Idh/MocA family protein [Cohnella hashimotonis]|uniref:Gfo/Idh/MocA family oxidoreductase n=1 Tax=Cohnella hashimotonis TaxID=2826895 RepID=A0ABT6TE37_9BACL|nr:Gfo/Idh/MocA family oxidoreductase [Cohnella hashimotonis]MDI4645029.1 Gfo/Idh/MocA family oxidoreductase [Cohnella hashimotonis]
MKIWKLGLAGLGGSRRSAAYMHHPRIRVTAICDQDADLLRQTGDELGIDPSGRFDRFDKLLASDVDVVMIGTPLPLHAEQAIAAMKAGKDVLCEVTAASTIEDCVSLVDTVKDTGRTYMMAENTVYFHFLQNWKQWIRQGLIGTVFHAECEYVHDIRSRIIDPDTGFVYWRNERPPLHYCSHSLGPILEMLDDRIVRAMGIGSSKSVVPNGGVGCIDMQVALFETSKGCTIKLLRSSVAPRTPEIGHYALYGSKGQIENGRHGYEGDGWIYVENHPLFGETAQSLKCEISNPDATEAMAKGGHGTSEYYLLQDFIDALDRRSQPPIDVYRAIDYTLPGIVAQQSAEQGGIWLEVPDLRIS